MEIRLIDLKIRFLSLKIQICYLSLVAIYICTMGGIFSNYAYGMASEYMLQELFGFRYGYLI